MSLFSKQGMIVLLCFKGLIIHSCLQRKDIYSAMIDAFEEYRYAHLEIVCQVVLYHNVIGTLKLNFVT